LGKQSDLDKFEEIYERVSNAGTDSHFIKLLSNEITMLKEIIEIKK